MPEEKKKCFVITPIGSDGSAIRRHIDGIIQAAIIPILQTEYDVVVAHRISEPGSITKQVIRHIYEDELVITNLTERNPNVMYELAFRHSLGKPVIMIAEKGTNLPSDIIMERTIFYQNDASGVLELREELKKALEEIDFEKVSSPIHDVLRDIDREAKIVKLSEESSPELSSVSGDALKYIIDRLDRIEKNISSEKIANDTGFLEAIFSYKKAPIALKSEENIYEYIFRHLAMFANNKYLLNDILQISLDEYMHKVTLVFTSKVMKYVKRNYIFLENALVEAGFVGVEFVEIRER